MKIGKSLGIYLSALTILFFFAGCSTLEEKPPVIQKPIISKSTIYFYRPDDAVFGWSWKAINIMEIHTTKKIIDPDNKSHLSHIGVLKNNSYIKKEFTSGTHSFTSNWRFEPDQFLLKPDDYICIKAEIGFFNALFSRATLTKVNKSTCKAAIKNARHLSS